MCFHIVFPLARTVAKKYDKENCQHQIYVQKSMVNTKHYEVVHEKSASRKKEREIFLKIAKIYTYEVMRFRQE